MSVDANIQPVGLDEWDITHRTCCRPDWSLCGRSLAGGDWLPEDEQPVCESCAALMTRPCRASFCRLRRLWRAWRGIRWSEAQR